MALIETRRPAAAVEILEAATEAARKTVEPNDPILVTLEVNLAYALLAAERSPEALRQLAEMLPRLEEAYGPAALPTLNTKQTLVALYRTLDQKEAAFRLQETMVEDCLQAYGEISEGTVQSRFHLAVLAVRLEKREELKELLRLLGPYIKAPPDRLPPLVRASRARLLRELERDPSLADDLPLGRLPF